MQPKISEATKRKLEALQWEAEKKDCLKDIYQFLFEVQHGMYKDAEDQSILINDNQFNKRLIYDATELCRKMESYFAHEITIDNDP